MTVPRNNLKELHNISLLHPIVVAAGCTLEKVQYDFNKVDCMVIGCDWDSTPQLNAQLKATSSDYSFSKDKKNIKYPLDARTYNKLTGNNFTPTVLLLAIIPENESDRVLEGDGKLTLNGSLYWAHIKGKRTDNDSSITIDIPLENKFSSETIKEIMTKLDTKGPLGLSI